MLPLHPFLFAAASVLGLYASNLRELYFSEIAPTLIGVLGVALALFLLFGAAFRSLGAKPALLASASLIVGLSYVPIVRSASQTFDLGLSPIAALPIAVAALALAALVLSRTRSDLSMANVVLNAVAFAIFISPAWQAASHEWRVSGGASLAAQASNQDLPETRGALPTEPTESETTPDIYYFIFDRYASEEILSTHYGFDNSPLTDFLKANGFFVAPGSHANYLKTAHSLASTFQMDYLDLPRGNPRVRAGDWHPLHDMLDEHRVARFLKSAGYKFIQVGAWWGPTQHNSYADETYSFGYSEFATGYLQRSIMPAGLNAVAPETGFAQRLRSDLGQCYRVPRQIAKVAEAAERRESTFVFAHILVPHDPYVFGPDGRCLLGSDAIDRTEDKAYVEQVQFANLMIRDFVTTLLNREGPKPIIIIQADEGPFPERYRNKSRSWREATADELKIKTGILNAFYFPDGDYEALYPDITSVNTFRVLFNKYFGTSLAPLPDRIYGFPDLHSIYDLYEITDVVRKKE